MGGERCSWRVLGQRRESRLLYIDQRRVQVHGIFCVPDLALNPRAAGAGLFRAFRAYRRSPNEKIGVTVLHVRRWLATLRGHEESWLQSLPDVVPACRGLGSRCQDGSHFPGTRPRADDSGIGSPPGNWSMVRAFSAPALRARSLRRRDGPVGTSRLLG